MPPGFDLNPQHQEKVPQQHQKLNRVAFKPNKPVLSDWSSGASTLTPSNPALSRVSTDDSKEVTAIDRMHTLQRRGIRELAYKIRLFLIDDIKLIARMENRKMNEDY